MKYVSDCRDSRRTQWRVSKLVGGRLEIGELACKKADTIMQFEVKRRDCERILSDSKRFRAMVQFSRERQSETARAHIFREQFERALHLTRCANELSLLCQADSQLEMAIAICRVQLKAMLGLRNRFVRLASSIQNCGENIGCGRAGRIVLDRRGRF